MQIVCGKPVFTLTEEEIEELDRRAREYDEKVRLAKIANAFYTSGLAEDSLNASFFDFDRNTEEEQKLYNVAQIFLNNRAISAMVLCGKNGTGKTYTAACCLRELGGKYRKSIEICSEYDDAAKPYAKETQRMVMDRYTGANLLVIDEVMRTPNSKEREVISYIVSARIERNRKTIVIGNCTRAELLKVLDGAVMSRIQKSGLLIELNGVDHRCM